MKTYIVDLIDNKSNRLENKEFYSILNKKDFRKQLKKDLKEQGYGKIMFLKIEEVNYG